MIREVPGLRSASRWPGSEARRGVSGAPRQKNRLGGFEGSRIPPQRSLSLWAICQTPRARKAAHTCRWSWTERRAVSGVSRRGYQWILFGLLVGARQVAETDLEGLSTGRSDTSSVAADTRHGRGRPVTPAGRVEGVTAASKLFPGENDGRLAQWHSATNRGLAQSNQPHSSYEGTKVHTYIRTYLHSVVYGNISSCGILFHVVYCNLQFFQQPWRSPIYSRPESELRRVHSLNCTRQFCALEA